MLLFLSRQAWQFRFHNYDRACRSFIPWSTPRNATIFILCIKYEFFKTFSGNASCRAAVCLSHVRPDKLASIFVKYVLFIVKASKSRKILPFVLATVYFNGSILRSSSSKNKKWELITKNVRNCWACSIFRTPPVCGHHGGLDRSCRTEIEFLEWQVLSWFRSSWRYGYFEPCFLVEHTETEDGYLKIVLERCMGLMYVIFGSFTVETNAVEKSH